MGPPAPPQGWSMKVRWLKYSIAFAVVVLLGALVCQFRSGPSRYARHVYVASNNRFRIRVRMFPEQGIGFVLGAYYVFDSAATNSDKWVHILTSKEDDPDPIHRERIRLVNENVAYVFMPRDFAVTTNGGASWKVWNITRDLEGWHDHRSSITDVNIYLNGRGTMKLAIVGNRQGELHTTDFGYHWGP
jgi:hypothetical protein